MTETEAIERLAAAPVLLVATDFDGTISEIVSRPADATALADATVALDALNELPKTHVAIVSGRALADLRERPGVPGGLRYIGSHGLEDDALGGSIDLDPDEQRRLERVRALARRVTATAPGTWAEDKPAGVTLHYRQAAPEVGLRAARSFAEGLSIMPEVEVRSSKAAIEASVRPMSKGRALARLRAEYGATVVCYLGDDDTDEEAFAALEDDDVSVRVGEGRTKARLRLPDPAAAANFLARLAVARREALAH
jgi:trehalose-phosphatase